MASRGGRIVDGEGGLVGPFNAWLHAAGVGGRLSGLGFALRFETSLDRRLLELAIIVVAAHWKAEFEWWAHARMAREHGIADEVVAAIERGETPSFAARDEAVVHAFASQLVAGGGVDDATFTAAVERLGRRGVVELVSLCGYYTLVSFTLNAFAVPLPPGTAPAWPNAGHPGRERR